MLYVPIFKMEKPYSESKAFSRLNFTCDLTSSHSVQFCCRPFECHYAHIIYNNIVI